MNQVFEVEGMTCGHCVQAVTAELKKIPGVQDVEIQLESGKVTVTSATELNPQDVSTAIDEAGYKLIG